LICGRKTLEKILPPLFYTNNRLGASAHTTSNLVRNDDFAVDDSQSFVRVVAEALEFSKLASVVKVRKRRSDV
jgi:hypothetical protein